MLSIVRLRRHLRAFAVARGGNVAITFGIALLPLMAAVGAAIDYSRGSAARAGTQAALDATALMLAKEAANDDSDTLQQNALKYFKANLKDSDATGISVTATYDPATSSVQAKGSLAIPTTFMQMLGYRQMNIGASSTATWGSTLLRVALVLDNTGSMADSGKLTALKSATKDLLTQLQKSASTNGDVYVSIVPFVKDVNLDAANYDSSWDSWIDWTNLAPSGSMPSSSVGPGSSCPYSTWTNGYTCVTKAGGSSTTGTVPTSGKICPSNSIGCYDSVAHTTTTSKVVSTGKYASCSGYSNCSCTGSGSNKACTVTTTSTSYTHDWSVDATKWNGCITDRGSSSGPASDYDRLVTEPDLSVATSKFPAEQYSACPQAVLGLSYNWTAMRELVDNMVANGSTNQPIGLVWGWQTLVGGGPFTAPPMNSNEKYQQVIILLSDGLNTQDRWYGNGTTTSTSVDHRMYDTDGSGTCANAKAAGIMIYTIQVNTGGDPTSTLLKKCASSTDKFYLLTSSSGIANVFSTIGTQLTKLRVSK